MEQRLDELEADVHTRFQAGSDRMDAIEKKLDANSEATARVEANTAEMLEFFNSVRGAFRVLDMLGKLAKPLAYIMMFIGACTGVWLALKNGGRIHE